MPIQTLALCINVVLRWCVKLAQSSSWNLKVFCSKLIGRSWQLQEGEPAVNQVVLIYGPYTVLMWGTYNFIK